MGQLEAQRFVIILAALLVVQFLMSPEIYASAAFLSTVAVALAFRMAPAEEREPLVSVGMWIILAYAISAMVLLPYLNYMFVLGAPSGVFFSPWRTSIDLSNFFVPTINESAR